MHLGVYVCLCEYVLTPLHEWNTENTYCGLQEGHYQQKLLALEEGTSTTFNFEASDSIEMTLKNPSIMHKMQTKIFPPGSQCIWAE